MVQAHDPDRLSAARGEVAGQDPLGGAGDALQGCGIEQAVPGLLVDITGLGQASLFLELLNGPHDRVIESPGDVQAELALYLGDVVSSHAKAQGPGAEGLGLDALETRDVGVAVCGKFRPEAIGPSDQPRGVAAVVVVYGAQQARNVRGGHRGAVPVGLLPAHWVQDPALAQDGRENGVNYLAGREAGEEQVGKTLLELARNAVSLAVSPRANAHLEALVLRDVVPFDGSVAGFGKFVQLLFVHAHHSSAKNTIAMSKKVKLS